MNSSLEIKRWVCKKLEDIKSTSNDSNQWCLKYDVIQCKEACVAVIADGVQKAEGLSAPTTIIQSILYDVRDIIQRYEDSLPDFESDSCEVVASIKSNTTKLHAWQLRPMISCLRSTVIGYRKQSAHLEQLYNITLGKLRRKENVISYIRKTLYAEVISLREQLYQKSMGADDESYFSVFDFVNLLDCTDANDEVKEAISTMKLQNDKQREGLIQKHSQEMSIITHEVSSLRKDLLKKNQSKTTNQSQDSKQVEKIEPIVPTINPAILVEKEKEISILQGTVKSLTSIIDKQTNELDDVLLENDTAIEVLQSKLYLSEKEISSQEESLDIIQKERDQLSASYEGLKYSFSRLQEQHNNLNDAHQSQERDFRAEHARMGEELLTTKAEAVASQRVVKDGDHKIDELLASATELQEAVSKSAKVQSQLSAEKSDLTELTVRLKQTIEQTADDKQKLSTEIKALQRTINSEQDLISNLTLEVSQVRQQSTLLNDESNKQQIEIARLNNELNSSARNYAIELQQIRDQASVAENFMKSNRKTVQSSQQAIEDLSHQLSTMKRNFETYKTEAIAESKLSNKKLEVSASEITKLTFIKRERETKISTLEEVINKLNESNLSLQTIQDDLQRNIDKLSQDLEQAAVQERFYVVKVSQFEDEIAKLRGKLGNAKTYSTDLKNTMSAGKSKKEAARVVHNNTMDALREAQTRLETQSDTTKAKREQIIREMQQELNQRIDKLSTNSAVRMRCRPQEETICVIKWALKATPSRSIATLLSSLSEYRGVAVSREPGEITATFNNQIFAIQWSAAIKSRLPVRIGISHGVFSKSVILARHLSEMSPVGFVMIPTSFAGKELMSTVCTYIAMLPIYVVCCSGKNILSKISESEYYVLGDSPVLDQDSGFCGERFDAEIAKIRNTIRDLSQESDFDSDEHLKITLLTSKKESMTRPASCTSVLSYSSETSNGDTSESSDCKLLRKLQRNINSAVQIAEDLAAESHQEMLLHHWTRNQLLGTRTELAAGFIKRNMKGVPKQPTPERSDDQSSVSDLENQLEKHRVAAAHIQNDLGVLLTKIENSDISNPSEESIKQQVSEGTKGNSLYNTITQMMPVSSLNMLRSHNNNDLCQDWFDSQVGSKAYLLTTSTAVQCDLITTQETQEYYDDNIYTTTTEIKQLQLDRPMSGSSQMGLKGSFIKDTRLRHQIPEPSQTQRDITINAFSLNKNLHQIPQGDLAWVEQTAIQKHDLVKKELLSNQLQGSVRLNHIKGGRPKSLSKQPMYYDDTSILEIDCLKIESNPGIHLPSDALNNSSPRIPCKEKNNIMGVNLLDMKQKSLTVKGIVASTCQQLVSKAAVKNSKSMVSAIDVCKAVEGICASNNKNRNIRTDAKFEIQKSITNIPYRSMKLSTSLLSQVDLRTPEVIDDGNPSTDPPLRQPQPADNFIDFRNYNQEMALKEKLFIGASINPVRGIKGIVKKKPSLSTFVATVLRREDG